MISSDVSRVSGAVLGGVYGRPVVLANLVLYFVSALSALRALPIGGPRRWVAAGPAVALAVVYGALLAARSTGFPPPRPTAADADATLGSTALARTKRALGRAG